LKRIDDFTVKVKELLAKRVGMRCSNPNCRALTVGPSSKPNSSISVGMAAHITAAQPGGPRYDAALSQEERRSPENGLWCCYYCGKLVDSDECLYSTDILKRWKSLSEEATLLEIQNPRSTQSAQVADRKLLQFYAQCFDRAAFQDEFRQEGSMDDFDRAIEDTIIAFNTGCQRDRNGLLVPRANGKAYITNPQWRAELDTIVDMLRAIRSRYALGRKMGLIHVWDHFHCINDAHTAYWMDQTRNEILELFGQVASHAGISSPRGLTRRRQRR
jgi:hypothetical protein